MYIYMYIYIYIIIIITIIIIIIIIISGITHMYSFIYMWNNICSCHMYIHPSMRGGEVV